VEQDSALSLVDTARGRAPRTAELPSQTSPNRSQRCSTGELTVKSELPEDLALLPEEMAIWRAYLADELHDLLFGQE
jgi:hypothetical protein